MPKSKVRTEDWVRLANMAVSAREKMRAAMPAVQALHGDLSRELANTPRSSYTWVRTKALRQMIEVYMEVGHMFTSALKDRENLHP